jgi:preprotein translocase subunit Sss1
MNNSVKIIVSAFLLMLIFIVVFWFNDYLESLLTISSFVGFFFLLYNISKAAKKLTWRELIQNMLFEFIVALFFLIIGIVLFTTFVF